MEDGKGKMAETGYTILILTDLTAAARQLRLSQRALGGLLGGLAALLLLGAYLGYHYIAYQVDRAELHRLRTSVEAQQGMATRLETLAQELNHLRTVDHHIRRLAGMEVTPAAESTVAVGGGTAELQQALAEGERAAKVDLLARLYTDLERLEREVALREESLQALTAYLTEQKDRLAATPSIWPTQGYVSSKFGPRTSPFTGQRQQHSGIDIATPAGTPIRAPADGVVTFAGTLAGYGRAIVLTHGFGFKTFYGHNSQNLVTKGQRVHRGDVIGHVGNSGYSTGSHLHYEVLVKDAPVNPLKYILDEERRANVIRGE